VESVTLPRVVGSGPLPASYIGMVDWSVFMNARPPAKGDPTRIYRPEDYDFTLAAGSAAIDAGVALPGVSDGHTGRGG